MDTSHTILLLFTGITHLFGFDELSRGKNTTQSTTSLCYHPCGPDKAVDGDSNTCMRTEDIGTSSAHKTVWWIVDLGVNHSIYSIRINFKDYREDEDYNFRQRGRFAGFSLYLSYTPKKEDGRLCYNNTLPLPPLDFNTTCIGYGRYVIYYNERLDEVTYPEEYQNQSSFTELCEVNIQGCSDTGVYGSNCSIPCPINCQEQRCNIVDGTCLGCSRGYVGQICKDECIWGFHGLGCKRQCTGHCARNTSCNHVTGNCDEGCVAGWMGKECDQQCKSGTYGPGCVYNCSGHCLNGTLCKKENGFCEKGCNPGFVGILCNTSCQSGIFGTDCSEPCSKFCKNGICDKVNGNCIKGCLNGYAGMRCLNPCPNGTFGYECGKTCSKNCIAICNHTDGRCDCLPRFTGSPNCKTECTQGFFGVNCQHRCGHCMNGEACSKFDGGCPNGCQDQYRGLLCDYQDETPTGKWTVEFYILVVLSTIFGLFIFVFLILIRQGALKFIPRKIAHPIPRVGEETNVGSAGGNTTTEKPFYEEIKTIQILHEYQELEPQNIIPYENLQMSNT